MPYEHLLKAQRLLAEANEPHTDRDSLIAEAHVNAILSQTPSQVFLYANDLVEETEKAEKEFRERNNEGCGA
jgi:hypothetical protein